MVIRFYFIPAQIDAYAVTIALVGYLVVFLALVMLYLVFSKLPVFLEAAKLSRRPGRETSMGGVNKDAGTGREATEITGEVNAAIGMAIYLYLNELHDRESGVLTIKKISRRYSPWSSKIYSLRHNPRV